MSPTCPSCNHTWKTERKKSVEQIVFNAERIQFEGIKPTDLGVWISKFPAIDVMRELRKMEAWLYANPSKRKKKYVRFINGWLSRVITNTVEPTKSKQRDGLM
jgi:hypothetical protein